MGDAESKKDCDAELWNSIPFDEQVWIDVAIDQGNKLEAAMRCVYSGKGFTLASAKRIVDERAVELAKRNILKKT